MAGMFARQIEAKRLVLTHFSSRYKMKKTNESKCKLGLKYNNEDNEVVNTCHDIYTYFNPSSDLIIHTLFFLIE